MQSAPVLKKHWVEQLAERVAQRCFEKKKSVCVINGGLSVSGLQHVGRLRGEIVMNDVIARILERGYGL